MRAFTATFVLASIAASALAHGGEYHGPRGEPPPEECHDPSDPPPPPSDWAAWWADAKDEFAPRAADDSREAARRAVATATPRLREIVFDEARNFRVRAAAMTALARGGDDSVAPFARKIALADGESVRREFRESATLALGFLGRADATTRTFLADVLVHGPRDGSFVRAFAALALALLGDEPSTTRALLAAVARPESEANVKPACLLALGLIGDASAAADLASIVRDGRLADDAAASFTVLERAYAYEALARIDRGRGAEFALLSAPLRGRVAFCFEVQRVAAATIGRIPADVSADRRREIIDLLVAFLDDATSDTTAHCLATISLGRLGATGDADERKRILAVLQRRLDEDSDDAAPFAAAVIACIARSGADAERVALAKIARRIAADPRDAVRTAFAAVRDAVDRPSIEVRRLDALTESAPADVAASAIEELGRLVARDDAPRVATDADPFGQIAAIAAARRTR